MEIFSFTSGQGRQIDQHGSIGAFITPIIRHADGLSVVSMRIEPGGVLGLHPASADQIFRVTAGCSSSKATCLASRCGWQRSSASSRKVPISL